MKRFKTPPNKLGYLFWVLYYKKDPKIKIIILLNLQVMKKNQSPLVEMSRCVFTDSLSIAGFEAGYVVECESLDV